MSTTLILQQSVNGVVLACDYTLFALGLSVTWGVLKVMNLAHAELFSAGALLTVGLSRTTGLPFISVLLISALAGGVLAVIVDTVGFWPLRRRRLSTAQLEMTSLITSLGMSTALVAVLTQLSNNGAPEQVSGRLINNDLYHLGAIEVSNIQILVTGTALVLTFATWWIVGHTQFGRALRAMASSADMARVMGVRTEVYYRGTLFSCGALAAVAGALLTLVLGSVNSYSGEDLMVTGIAIIVLAGAGQILGLLVGAIVLAFGQTVGSIWLPAAVQGALPFVVLLAVLLVRPSGLFGRPESVRT